MALKGLTYVSSLLFLLYSMFGCSVGAYRNMCSNCYDEGEKSLYNEEIPLHTNFDQYDKKDCQTVAAMKYKALVDPEGAESMVRVNDDGSFRVIFPRIDFDEVYVPDNEHFDYETDTVSVTCDDISQFRDWYGKTESPIQEIVWSALLKKMKDSGKGFSSVKEAVDFWEKGGKERYPIRTQQALTSLTGNEYYSMSIEGVRKLQNMPENELTESQKKERDAYMEKGMKLLTEGKIAIACQHRVFYDSKSHSLTTYGDIASSISEFLKEHDEIDKIEDLPKDINGDGIVENHSYAVIYDKDADSVTLYNPWNYFEPGMGADGANDGVFSMPPDEFLKAFTFMFVKKK